MMIRNRIRTGNLAWIGRYKDELLPPRWDPDQCPFIWNESRSKGHEISKQIQTHKETYMNRMSKNEVDRDLRFKNKSTDTQNPSETRTFNKHSFLLIWIKKDETNWSFLREVIPASLKALVFVAVQGPIFLLVFRGQLAKWVTLLK